MNKQYEATMIQNALNNIVRYVNRHMTPYHNISVNELGLSIIASNIQEDYSSFIFQSKYPEKSYYIVSYAKEDDNWNCVMLVEKKFIEVFRI